jgi:hypothetical protein
MKMKDSCPGVFRNAVAQGQLRALRMNSFMMRAD